MTLSPDDKNNLKIFANFKQQLDNTDVKITCGNDTLEDSILRAEALMRKMQETQRKSKHIVSRKPLTFNSEKKDELMSLHNHQKSYAMTYEQILAEANQQLGVDTEYGFEDILTPEEIQKAINRVDEINDEFSRVTGLGEYDIAFIALATALQTVKWICLPEIGNPFAPSSRMAHDDPSIEKQHKDTLNNYRDEHYQKDSKSNGDTWEPNKDQHHRKSWIEILFTKAPYDKIKGSAALELNLTGTNHRLKTLGHDPILGWIFGTANFMTDTASLSDFRTFRIYDAKWQNELVPLGQLFQETVDLTMYDKHCLAAALVAQGAHLASDRYTKMGLPIPILNTIAPDFASKLYSEHYDNLCLARDCKIVATSAVISTLINMIIGFVHGLLYDPNKHGANRDLYEVRTRKILLISNTIASSSNVIYCCITKNPHKLDLGGLLITATRWFSDIRFMTRIKEEFIQTEIDKDLKKQLSKLDNLYKDICS